jgi:sec-independent protein translocase protein TatA
MFGLGIPELIVIFVIALVVFGPKKLPDLGKSIGRAMSEFKKAQQEFQESVQSEMREVEKTAELEKVRELGKIDIPDYTEQGAEKPAVEQYAEKNSESLRKKGEEAKGNG